MSKKLSSLPRVIVLDLDGTVWAPEMYQLWSGGGAPFKTKNNGHSVHDKSNQEVTLLGDTRDILSMLLAHEDVRTGKTKLATASTCDEPAWAQECLSKFLIECPRTGAKKELGHVFHHHEIFSAYDKKEHFRNIAKATGASYEEMIFFDNQRNNVEVVSRLGVRCVYTPNGMTWQHWCEHLPRPGL